MELFGIVFTIKELILAIFSGVGVAVIGWIFSKKTLTKKITQKENTVFGDMAGENISKTIEKDNE